MVVILYRRWQWPALCQGGDGGERVALGGDDDADTPSGHPADEALAATGGDQQVYLVRKFWLVMPTFMRFCCCGYAVT